MYRSNIRNHTFNWMGEKFAPLIDRDHFLGYNGLQFPWRNLPAVNVISEGPLFRMEMAVPGFNKEELEVVVKDNVLTVKGKKRQKNEMPPSRYILEEFGNDSFERKFRLGDNIGKEKITANYKNGILEITFVDVPAEEEKTYQEVNVM